MSLSVMAATGEQKDRLAVLLETQVHIGSIVLTHFGAIGKLPLVKVCNRLVHPEL